MAFCSRLLTLLERCPWIFSACWCLFSGSCETGSSSLPSEVLWPPDLNAPFSSSSAGNVDVLVKSWDNGDGLNSTVYANKVCCLLIGPFSSCSSLLLVVQGEILTAVRHQIYLVGHSLSFSLCLYEVLQCFLISRECDNRSGFYYPPAWHFIGLHLWLWVVHMCMVHVVTLKILKRIFEMKSLRLIFSFIDSHTVASLFWFTGQ